jgi:erythromycin esterase-like protein
MKRLLSVVLLTGFGLPLAQPVPSLKPALPINAINAILDAFQSHAIVALGEPHGNEQAAAFRMALIRDPRFPEVAESAG